jgi:uncharacterized protein (DUF427 family)
MKITRPKPIVPGPDQESVWDYPRPPRLERTSKRIQIIFNGEMVADTALAWRVLETSHPPVYYLPPKDIKMEYLHAAGGGSWCEWKGQAVYYDLLVGERTAPRSAWAYPKPTADFIPLKDHLAFYAWAMDQCLVDGELVMPQPGNFYGGWITSDIVGPFKGTPGSSGW